LENTPYSLLLNHQAPTWLYWPMVLLGSMSMPLELLLLASNFGEISANNFPKIFPFLFG
jgi:hypothetical protein